MPGMVHQGFVFQESAGVRVALVGSSYFLPHTADPGSVVAKAVTEAWPWKPEGTDVHAAITEPAIARFTAGEAFVDGIPVAKFDYAVGAKTDSFTELFLTGDLVGSLLIGKQGLTLRKSWVPYVLSEEAVAKAWMPAEGESGLPASLERDIPPELRYWRAAEGVSAASIRDYIVKSGFLSDTNIAPVDGKLRRLETQLVLPDTQPEALEVKAPAPPVFKAEKPALTFAEVQPLLDPASVGVRNLRVMKADAPEEQRYILGVVLEPEVADSQDEIYSAEEIRKSAHGFLAKFRNVGLQHVAIINGLAEVVESYIAPADMEIEGNVVKKGTWLMGIHVLEDSLWEACKDGTLTGLSIGGLALRTPDVQ